LREERALPPDTILNLESTPEAVPEALITYPCRHFIGTILAPTPGCVRRVGAIRWLRSFLAQPPATGCNASGISGKYNSLQTALALKNGFACLRKIQKNTKGPAPVLTGMAMMPLPRPSAPAGVRP
jgi:hypothetical protein